MNRETILRIAKECGERFAFDTVSDYPQDLERFAHRMMAEGVKEALDVARQEALIQQNAYTVWAKLRLRVEQLEKGIDNLETA